MVWRRHHSGAAAPSGFCCTSLQGTEHGVIVDGGFGTAVPKFQKNRRPHKSSTLNAPPSRPLQASSTRAQTLHRRLRSSALDGIRFLFLALRYSSRPRCFSKAGGLHSQSAFQNSGRRASNRRVRNTKPGFQQDHHLVIILGIDGIVLHEVQKLVFLCRGKRHLWYGIIVDNLIDLEVKGILAEAVVLVRPYKRWLLRNAWLLQMVL